MNILTALILIAVGADDVFIYVDIWDQVKAEFPSHSMSLWVSKTLRHAAVSIFVTSLTTAAAFYANYVSDISSVKCFGIFSGTAILVNFALMVTWIPAVIVCVERCSQKCCSKVKCCSCYERLSSLVTRCLDIIFGKALPWIVIKLWIPLLILLLALGVGSLVVVYYTPKLELPSTDGFMVFHESNPIERFDKTLDMNFKFIQEREAFRGYNMDAVALFGVHAKDNGNHIDPDDEGHLELDTSFDIAHPDSQLFLKQFCDDLKSASFADSITAAIPCSMDLFSEIIQRPCVSELLSPCCGQPSFPVSRDVFQQCFVNSMLYVKQCLQVYRMMMLPYFDRNTTTIKAIEAEFYTTQVWTPSFDPMDKLYRTMENFMSNKLKSAPDPLKTGWFTSYFDFYDLQLSLSTGTYIAMGISLLVSFVVLFLISLNLLITVYAILTIGFTITSTVAALVLLGWELNILESVTISLAVGLSIDFSIHYGVAYKLSTSEDRKQCVRDSFQRVGSAVAMAALTTFLAGACIMPSHILSYVQLGTFLMLVMTFSWLYATFFFQALCAGLGPQGKCCQIPNFALRRESSVSGSPVKTAVDSPVKTGIDFATKSTRVNGSSPVLDPEVSVYPILEKEDSDKQRQDLDAQFAEKCSQNL